MSDDAQTPDTPGNGFEVDLTKRSGSGAQDATDSTAAAPSPWAPPAQASDGPGTTLASNAPQSWPAPSVHDQQTVTSMPGPAQPWAGPGGPADPFAPPAPYTQGEPVPPPPIAPDGPGQVPYGYPGGYGYPPQMGYGYPPQAGYGGYAWPGMQPPPSNGMGTTALVLGIISAAVFCLWPVAILLGVLALIFGLIGRGKVRRNEATNPGQALAGTICGAAGIVLGLVMVAFVIAT
ncbi:DUF4190 domain-containing protein [Streptomyces sp. NPDC050803]|uniref:DUF4190 domain-containing protein n=1 Tax=unclassified Streptomyces TaxID=2593676 RepID=UPI00343472C6